MRIHLLQLVVFAALIAGGALAQTSPSTPPEWKPVEQAMARSGQIQPGGVLKFSLPRRDLHVTINGVQVKPGFGLGSWVAFKRTAGSAMVMGDLVLVEPEVEPVLTRLQQGGIEVTALHNHLLGESPRVMYMHIGGQGDPAQLAQAVAAALKLTGTPEPLPPAQSSAPASTGLDQARIEAALGYSGKMNNGVLQFSVPRAETVTMHAQVVPPAMGVATAANFEAAQPGQAAITGDFVLLGSEVNPVLTALRDHAIDVTAVHSHMLQEEPRLFFVHFWAQGDPVKLAAGLRAALDRTNSTKTKSK